MTYPSADPDKIPVAVHEAGHAVVAILTGIPVRYATLAPRAGGGVVALHPRTVGYPALQSIAVSCAGPIAEDVAGVAQRWDIVDGADDDITHIRAVARGWYAKTDGTATVLDLITRSWELAFGLIADRYGALLAVAEALLFSRRALTGSEIRACVDGAPTLRPEDVPDDARTFWIPAYSRLRNWGPSASGRHSAGCREAVA